ncbi:MAG: LysM domain-containing protein [Rikenellaceae bacterium]
MEYTVERGQSLTDIAIQVYGSTQMLFRLASDNGLRVDSDVVAGAVLQYDDSDGDRLVAAAITTRSLTIFNAVDLEEELPTSNFLLADGRLYLTKDGLIFNVKK